MNEVFMATWVPVSEALPTEFGSYLCTIEGTDDVVLLEYGEPVSERWHGTDYVFADGTAFGEDWGIDGAVELDNLEKVAAWMPTPSPYKEPGQCGK